MKFMLGTKEKMSQIFEENGIVKPVTIIKAGPLTVTQLKTSETDGYSAAQFGFGKKKREARMDREEVLGFSQGQTVDVSVFSPGERVKISGLAKGKGFQGVVKRHGFHGGSRTHGQKHSEREPGSIGGGLRTRVPKNMKMAGRMGGKRSTTRNLEVVRVDKENNLLYIRGAVPGRRGTLVEIRSEK